MAADNNDTGNTNPEHHDSDNYSPSEQNPVRLTVGHYYCANCGRDGLSRGEPMCPGCQDYLRWDRVDI